MFTIKSISRLFPVLLVTVSLLALTFSALGVTPAYAATLTVTNTNDSGAGSLRQAIADAGLGDTITFAPALSGMTINLDTTLTLSKNVTIDGSALATKVAISGDTAPADGTGDVRVFSVNSGVTATLNSLTITKGFTNGDGGGIYSSGILTIRNSTLSDNYADNSGGGIYNNGGTLTITSSTLSGNSTDYDGDGGCIYNYGMLTITNSTLSGNYAGDAGGAIENFDTLTITNSTLSGNYTEGFGGGIANDCMLTIANSTLSGNFAGGGGGIYNGSTLMMTNSTLSGNSADHGGGIDNESTLTIANSTLSGNFAYHGGGIDNESYRMLTIKNSTLSGNSADYGGGIENDSYATLNYANTIIANSRARGDCSNFGRIGTNINNLVEDGTCAASLSGDPKLGALANNGGPAKTFALLAGSKAIGAGEDSVCAAAPVRNHDQRGVTRPQGAHCDIGSYEKINMILFTLNSIGTQDGSVLESGENSNVGGIMNTTATTFNLGDDKTRKQYCGILSFRTASLPDTADIIGVTLKLKKNAVIGGGNPVAIFQGFMVDIKNGFFGTSALLQASDFQAATGKTYGPYNTALTSGWYSINLTPGKAYINKLATDGGLTQIRLRFQRDDNNNAIANYLSLFSGNAPAANRPQLVVTYYVP